MSVPSSEMDSLARAPRRQPAHDAWLTEALGARLAGKAAAPQKPGAASALRKADPVARFKAALGSSKLDRSDFILNTTRLLKETLGGEAPAALNNVPRQYQVQDYDGAIATLVKVAEAKKELLGAGVCDLIAARAKTVKSDPNENRSRRLYENRLAAHLGADVRKSPTFKDSMAGLADVFLKRAAQEGVQPRRLPPPDDPRFADALIGQLMFLNDRIEMGLKAESPKYQAKDRSDVTKASKESGGSRNTGVMKGSAPNFADQLGPQQDSRVIDRNVIDPDKAGGQGYSKTNEDVPFVASISGTTFTLVTLMKDYLAAHRKSPTLQNGVDDIVKAFVAHYVSAGYHSYKEMMDVVHEPAVQKLFAEAEVTVEMQLSDEVVGRATAEAQAYAQGLDQKDALHDELRAKREETAPAAQGDGRKEPLLDLLRRTGTVDVFEGKTGLYLGFDSQQDFDVAVARLQEELGPEVFRVAGRANTIEMLKPLLARMGASAQPTIETLLRKGKRQTFKGREGQTYLLFAPGIFKVIQARIASDRLEGALRVTRMENLLQVMDDALAARLDA